MKIILLVIAIIYVSSSSYAQDNHKVDSLKSALQKHEARKKALGATATSMIDTTKADILFLLSNEYRQVDWEKQFSLAKECLALSEKIGYKKGIGNAYNNIGSYYYEEYPLEKAKEYHFKSLKIRLEIDDKEGICGSYNNIGLDYGDEGNSHEQLRNYLMSLKYAQQGRFRKTEAAVLHNIGMVYGEMGNYKEAFENYTKAQKINRETGNKMYLRANVTMIGALFLKQKKYKEALEYNFEGLSLVQELQLTSNSFIQSYQAIGNCYMDSTDYQSAIHYYSLMLSLAEKAKANGWTVLANIHIGTAYERQGKLSKAIHYLEHALSIVDKKDKSKMLPLHKELAIVYKKLKNFKAAWESYDTYEALKDTADNVENAKNKVSSLTQLLSSTAFEKQQDSTKAEQSKRDAVQNITRNALIAGFVLVLILALILYNRFRIKKKANELITLEKERSDNLLLNILPAEVADELKSTGTASAKHFDNVTVLFTDFKNFTTVSEQLSPQELVDELHACFKGFDEICTRYSIEKIKTIGDAYLAVSGLPLADENHAENVVNAALEIREFMKQRRENLGAKTFEIRIGINSGSVVAGIVGVKKFAYDIWGDTVNTAARMEQNSEPGKINISETTFALVKDRFTCEYRGEIDAKNKGKLKMYFVEKV
ncbi:MAG: tetratricopeptide repeat protein [Ignavibacteria bacterium]|nr:tetratricopeptide repeat protein [Ignavibacteria bacterium]